MTWGGFAFFIALEAVCLLGWVIWAKAHGRDE